MRRLLCTVLLLLFAGRLRAQRECARITLDDLRSTDNAKQSNILVQTYNMNINPSDPFILVEDMHIVCEAVGTKRDTFLFVSVVVRQICDGFVCAAETRNAPADVQYDFECSVSNVWVPETFGVTNVRLENPLANFDTEAKCDCSACARSLSGADPVTHCRPCSSSCDKGAKKCDGLGSSNCCNFYFEDVCVEECPLDTHVVDEDFNCVEPVECPELKDPVNGTVTVDDRFYPSEATYKCADGFDLSGVATRKCQIEGEWTDDAPVCESTKEEESGGGISNAELGVIVAVVVLFFLIVVGVFITFVAVWACKN